LKSGQDGEGLGMTTRPQEEAGGQPGEGGGRRPLKPGGAAVKAIGWVLEHWVNPDVIGAAVTLVTSGYAYKYVSSPVPAFLAPAAFFAGAALVRAAWWYRDRRGRGPRDVVRVHFGVPWAYRLDGIKPLPPFVAICPKCSRSLDHLRGDDGEWYGNRAPRTLLSCGSRGCGFEAQPDLPFFSLPHEIQMEAEASARSGGRRGVERAP
jgi:hypothetical protein